MIFRTIDIHKDRNTIIKFRKDSYIVSFGCVDGFGDEEDYIQRIAQRVCKFPEGLVIVEEKQKPIGQMELQIIYYEGKEIGYVNLYYLVPEYRGRGYGEKLVVYAESFFRKHHVKEYHLRVAPSNQRAIHFYLKSGMEKIKEEYSYNLVLRMRKQLI